MKISTQKTIGKVFAGVVLVGATSIVIGQCAKSCNSSSDNAGTAPQPAPQSAPVAVDRPAAPYYPPAPPAAHRDDRSEKELKLEALETADLQRLRVLGYAVGRPSEAFGRECNANGTTDGSGWHGTSTSLSYPVKRNGQDGTVCITHSGRGGSKAGVGDFVPAAGSTRGSYGSNSTNNNNSGSTGGNPEKQAKLEALETADLQRLHDAGYAVGKPSEVFGGKCNSDGTTDNSGWHGTSTSLSYPVKRNGQPGTVCITHGGKGGLNAGMGSFVRK